MENKRFTLQAGIPILFVLLIYTWFIGMGSWRARGYTSDYYSRLARSFQLGQLELEEKPDPALLALPNPYDHRARKEVPVVGDASLYKGKYYLYFGPFPSVPLALITAVLPAQPGDQIFVYLFMIGLFFLQCLLFMDILRRFFPELPGWNLPLGILLLGLTGPYTRMLAHPFIHEAAIAGGQFMFIAGFYLAFLALNEKPIHSGKLLLAGTLWAGSIATRVTLLFAVGFMAGLTLIFIYMLYRRSRLSTDPARSALALTGPLFVCGAILAWYNWARFDSIFEFGLYYQLAAFNLQDNYPILFSRIYLIQNIYNYFLHPFELTGHFPFAYPLPGSEQPVLDSFKLPNLYAVEGKFPGVLTSTPFLLFSILPVLIIAISSIRNLRIVSNKDSLFDWTILGLLGSFVAGAIPTLLLFYVGFRYEADFLPSLTLLGLIGFCQGIILLKNTDVRKLFTILGISLAVFSVLASVILAYTGLRG